MHPILWPVVALGVGWFAWVVVSYTVRIFPAPCGRPRPYLPVSGAYPCGQEWCVECWVCDAEKSE